MNVIWAQPLHFSFVGKYSYLVRILTEKLNFPNRKVKHFIFYFNFDIWITLNFCDNINIDVWIYQPLRTDRMRHKVNFEAGFNRFEFRFFLLQDWLLNQYLKKESALLSNSKLRENYRIHIFFRRVLLLWKMQSASSRIWTRVVYFPWQ